MNAFHRHEVDHQPALDGRASRHVVSAATDRHLKTQFSREIDGVDYVGHTTAASNQYRTLVHQTVVDFPCLLVAHIGGL